GLRPHSGGLCGSRRPVGCGGAGPVQRPHPHGSHHPQPPVPERAGLVSSSFGNCSEKPSNPERIRFRFAKIRASLLCHSGFAPYRCSEKASPLWERLFLSSKK